jgi:hypothetical protein
MLVIDFFKTPLLMGHVDGSRERAWNLMFRSSSDLLYWMRCRYVRGSHATRGS